MAENPIGELPIPAETFHLVVLSDASWANAANECIKAGFMAAASHPLLAHGHRGGFAVMRWKSFKQDRPNLK